MWVSLKCTITLSCSSCCDTLKHGLPYFRTLSLSWKMYVAWYDAEAAEATPPPSNDADACADLHHERGCLMLSDFVLWCLMMSCGVSWCVVVSHGLVVCCDVLWCVVLWCLVVSHGLVVCCDVLWCIVLWCLVVSHGLMVCCGVSWSRGVLWCLVVSHGVLWCLMKAK